MAKNSEFYKGRRKRRSYAIVPAVTVLLLAALVIVLFYSMQQYAVITKDGVSVKLPGFNDDSHVTVDAGGNVVHSFDPVDINLVFDDPDYSEVEQQVDGRVKPLRAIFVAPENMTSEKVDEYLMRLSAGNALVFEMKPRSGQLMWLSNASEAYRYGLSVASATTDAMPALISKVKESGVYLVAQISCCIDDMFASRSDSCTLKNEFGATYRDKNGSWLDPYSLNLRAYVVDMCRELYAMGFDEVVLADVMHPTVEEATTFMYTRSMTTTPTPEGGVCGFALSVAEDLYDREGLLSIYINSAYALVKTDSSTGQNAPFFLKLYDRVYYATEKYAYTYNIDDISRSVTVGKAEDRFVPVVTEYLPDNYENCSWVLIDAPPKDED